MKIRLIFSILLSAGILTGLYAQDQYAAEKLGDAEVARQYLNWAQQRIDEGHSDEALASLRRAADFAGVSSDISYLLAVVRSQRGESRAGVVENLNTALETNRWVSYSSGQALLLKAEQLVAMRHYLSALDILDQIAGRADSHDADAAMLRLLAFRGLAANPYSADGYFDPVQALARFRSLALSAMDRYPRDPRPLRIFFEYARNRKPQPSELAESDLNLLDLAIRRLPFLLEAGPDLAWIASPFMPADDARRLVASYRAGGLSKERPLAASIPAALNLGLIGDIDAVEELFGADNENPILPDAVNKIPVLHKNVVVDVYNLLRSEEGRDFFTGKLHSFNGLIFSDDDRDGIFESFTFYNLGVMREFAYDKNQSGVFNLQIRFDANGVPVSAFYPVTDKSSSALVQWERYPSVEKIALEREIFQFRPADFQFAPVEIIELGGSRSLAGLDFPVPAYQYMELTRRSLVSFCASISRPSVEFDGAQEQIFLERGIPRQAVETLDGKQVSITAFERGAPVVQRIDLDFDGRMETIRHFHRPGADYPWPDADETFDYRALIASSESDWTGEGKYKTGEAYLQDGSVVYSWDMDGSGNMNYSETENGTE